MHVHMHTASHSIKTISLHVVNYPANVCLVFGDTETAPRARPCLPASQSSLARVRPYCSIADGMLNCTGFLIDAASEVNPGVRPKETVGCAPAMAAVASAVVLLAWPC